ncbi:hypothetical protein KO02_12100 [Sphingobacterium sp. ML3W]|uniref:3'-5' exonuclease n=1 Tax=Sphingobacterium sp. ML3W TaxID=1538644 RepID=UPI0004F61268|nr:3'-5' exonuclease [Sphingobacterium sp. ML3W]AIM37352.1 hypothetical protein KO02_12100 [Sphingobacterium sp. ML3W]
MLALVLDTETNGFPTDWNLDFSHTDNWPRITQLSWVVVDAKSGYYFSKHNHIIKPDGWSVPTPDQLVGSKNPNFFVENNISTERCEKEGVPLIIALHFLMKDLSLCKLYINHNLKFDYNVVVSEMERYNVYPEKDIQKLCTMETTKDLLQLPGRGDFKLPSLQELHEYLFKTKFDGNHDAFADVKATADSFLELVRRGYYKI